MNHLEQVASEVLREAGISHERVAILDLKWPGAGDSRAVLLVFVDGASKPGAVIKVAMSTGGEDPFITEFENLSLLATCATPALKGSVPSPLYHGVSCGDQVLAQTALLGARMKNFPPRTYWGSTEFGGHFRGVLTWLSELRRSMEDANLPGADTLAGANESIETYRTHFDCSPELDALLDESRDALASAKLSLPPWHGDFCSANVHVTESGQIQVLDWEYSLRRSWPLADLVYFLASIKLVPGSSAKAHAANFRLVCFRDGISAHQGALQHHLTNAEIPKEKILPCSVLSWVEYANRKVSEVGLPPRDSQSDAAYAAHMPLTIIEDGRCQNLEALAAGRDVYLLTRG